MKNYYLITLFFIIVNSFIYAQVNPGCGTHLSPSEEMEFQKSLNKIEIYKKNKKQNPPGPYVIPVVFHMLTYGMNNGINSLPLTKNTMKCRIDDVMNVINGDFNGTSTPTSDIDPIFQSIRSTLNVQFVLATVDPDGNLMEIPGLDWQADAFVQSGYDPNISNYLWYGKNGKYYLDVVIQDYPNDGPDWQYASAHAFLPVQNVKPHVSYNHRYIGSVCGSDANSQFAKEMSHELGHYFGLRHTFQNGCNAPGDGIDDTPPTGQAEGCTRNVLNSCGVYANLENLMDYNVNCQSMFTTDQVIVMEYWLNDDTIANFPRKPLWDPNNLIAVGITPSTPIARFSPLKTTICSGESIQFIDQSVGIPTTRNWTFNGGTPSSSTDINPTVTYNTPGVYPVTLSVSNSNGNNSITKTALVKVENGIILNLEETFAGIFPPEGWEIDNPDQSITFEKRSNVGNGDSYCMIINNTDNAGTGEIDTITLPQFDLTNAQNSEFYFDVAYKKFDDNSPDILKVQVSTDCGNTWTDVYSKTHTVLETTNEVVTDPNGWRPTIEAHWRREFINMTAYQGQSNVSLRFHNTSGYGTRIWIDNVNFLINQAATPTSNFKASTTAVVCSNPIQFFDESTGNPTSWNWSFPGGNPSTSTLQNPSVSYTTPGTYSVTLTASNTNGNGSSITKTQYIKVYRENVPYNQDFLGNFPIEGWQIINPDFDAILWDKSTTVGLGDTSSLVINNADNPADKIDELILTPFDFTGITLPYLTFDLAYTQYLNATDPTPAPDVIDIFVSKDCGTTWTNVYSKNYLELQTVNPPIQDDPNTPNENETNDWVPSQNSDWRKEIVFLGNDLANEGNVLIKFKNTSGYGTRIWFDNLKIEEIPTPVTQFATNSTNVYCDNFPVTFSDLTTGNPISWQWSFPGGTPSSSTSQNPTIIYSTPGAYTVTLVTTNNNGNGTTEIKSNYVNVHRTNTPYLETMSGNFPIDGWQIINPDSDEIAWEKRADVGKDDTTSLVINNADNPEGKIDEVILIPFNFSGLTDPYLSFDLAYTQYLNATDPTPAPDAIDILVSKDCGTTWTNVYSKNYLQLQTVNPPIQDDPNTPNENETNDWIPTQDSDWREEVVNLGTAFSNESNVLIKFKNTSGYGTRIWFDNIKIENALSTNVSNNQLLDVLIYPNPVNDEIFIDFPTIQESYNITIYNNLGQKIYNEVHKTLKNKIQLSAYEKGIYFIKIESKNHKFLIQKIIKS